MCDNWRTTFFDNFSCSGKIEHINTGDLYVTGRLKTLNGQNGRVLFWAAVMFCPLSFLLYISTYYCRSHLTVVGRSLLLWVVA